MKASTSNQLPIQTRRRYPFGYSGGALRILSRRNASNVPPAFLARLSESSYLLDVGCGPASIIQDIQHSTGANVIGLDISAKFFPASASRTKNDSLRKQTYTAGDMHALPFCDWIFDATICSNTLLNSPHPEIAIRELIRVTKHGGIICIIEPIAVDCGPPGKKPSAVSLFFDVFHSKVIHCGGDPSVGARIDKLLPPSINDVSYSKFVMTIEMSNIEYIQDLQEISTTTEFRAYAHDVPITDDALTAALARAANNALPASDQPYGYVFGCALIGIPHSY